MTSLGLESRPPAPPFRILAAELLPVRDDGHGPYYEWPVDIALKTWVEIESFVEAFNVAVCHHMMQLPADHGIVLARTLDSRVPEQLANP